MSVMFTPGIDRIISLLSERKGEFERRGYVIRHKAMLDPNGYKACPVNALLGGAVYNHEFTGMAECLNVEYLDVSAVASAADGKDLSSPLRRALEAACLAETK
jgi:hypothetical protein